MSMKMWEDESRENLLTDAERLRVLKERMKKEQKRGEVFEFAFGVIKDLTEDDVIEDAKIIHAIMSVVDAVSEEFII